MPVVCLIWPKRSRMRTTEESEWIRTSDMHPERARKRRTGSKPNGVLPV